MYKPIIKVPFSTFEPMHNEIRSELNEAFERVLNNSYFILGEQCELFEREFASYCGTKFCVGVGTGLDALTLILRAMDIGAGDEVIVPSNTFIATALAVSSTGAIPVFVEPDDRFGIDVEKIEEKITDRTKAILVVHLYGMATKMDRIVELCRNYGLRLVEDCAQSHGACFDGKMTGTFGDVGCFSFYPSKNLGAFGDGGAVVVNDEQLYKDFKIFRNYGSEKRYYNKVVGANSRLDELQAGLLCVRLLHMKELTQEKVKIAEYYSTNIHNNRIHLPELCEGATGVWHQYVIRCEERERLIEYLDERGIGTIIHYPIPPHLAEAYRYLGYGEGFLPVTEHLAKTVLSIPIYNGMTKEEQDYVIAAINEFS